jgi:nicotinamide phosphoribosyltransferase
MLKQVIKEGLIKSGNVANLPFKLHDFGARGVSSSESAQIGGAAHLVNFKGSDTWEAIEFINEYYMEDMAGYSIPASEHSTITAWGKDRELEAYANMLEMFPDKMFACVSDSYNIINAVENLWGEKLKEKIKERTIPMVTRPDSGDPTDSPIDVIQRYAKKLGYSNNEKHFMIVNGMLVIQGDGNNEVVIPKTISKLLGLNYSLDNLSFGMGGELLQSFGRDDMQFAQKACAVKKHNSGWEGISKNPVGCDMKKSKHGIHETIIRDKKVISVPMEQVVASDERLLKTVYHNGELPNLQSFSEIRERSEDMSLVS